MIEALGCGRIGSDNACVRACRVKLSFRKINGNRRKCAHRRRARDKRQFCRSRCRSLCFCTLIRYTSRHH